MLCFLIIQLLAPSRLRGRSAQCADSGHLGRGSCEIPHVNTSVRSPLQIQRGKYKYKYKHMQAVTLTCLGVKWEAPLTAKKKIWQIWGEKQLFEQGGEFERGCLDVWCKRGKGVKLCRGQDILSETPSGSEFRTWETPMVGSCGKGLNLSLLSGH